MATYLNDLDWRSHPEDFDPNERRILLALSNERWDWLTVGALRKSANLREQEFEDALESLMSDGWFAADVQRTGRRFSASPNEWAWERVQ